jgi:CDP-glucose 4,6-dehydratase|tara:strand:+ start:6613 stop:7713 length:1101 start_codon:yes stop_codon:yes gene_type:complete
MFKDIYKGKKVLITGHTGFKGSWLTSWLYSLNANIIGVSKDIPSSPSMFEVLELEEKIQHHFVDIRNYEELHNIIDTQKPDFIFHLAAQPIVSTSYEDPIETISSNVIGTTNVLESLRHSNHECTAILITSDKAYDNIEQIWGYKEDDAMGGKDIYSGSKGAAELIIKSYYHSFFKLDKSNIRLAIARAGNVIGGGDWAKDRIVVDAMIAWSKGDKVEIRSPNATRPWQHVLEPLSGYLHLGQKLNANLDLHGEGFNFGPRAEQNRTVIELLEDSAKSWGFKAEEAYTITDNIKFHEAGLLKLNCDKALSYIDWYANLKYSETISFTSEWYVDFYSERETSMFKKTLAQIKEYQEIAKIKGLEWTE